MVGITWKELKSFISSRKISLQYIEVENYYKIFAFDGLFSVSVELSKTIPPNNDQVDFENNWKTLDNVNKPVIQQVAITLSEDAFKISAEGFKFLANANTTTTFDYQLNQKFMFRGLSFLSNNAILGDYINVQLVDKDNVLGLGAGIILASPIKKGYIMPTINSGPIYREDVSSSQIPIEGLYLRVNYTNASLLNNVDIYVNLFLYERETN